MADEPKLVTARDLPATIGGAPRPKQSDAQVAKFAGFAKISVDLARRTMESKNGEIIRAVAEGMGPEIAHYIRSQIGPLQARIADLERQTQANTQVVKGVEAALRGEQRVEKTILTRRDKDGNLVADVLVSDGTSINKYRGIWNADNQYNEGDVATHDGSAFIAKKSTRDKPGTNDSWQLMVKRGRDAKDAR